jgi:carbon starvation protein
VATTVILREAPRRRYALVTLLPLAFVSTTTITAGVQAIWTLYVPMLQVPETASVGRVNLLVTATLLVCVALVLGGSVRRWLSPRPAALAPAAD